MPKARAERRAPNGFEQLVAHKAAAVAKKGVRFVEDTGQQAKELQRLKTRFSEAQGMLAKRSKKSLFELNSDEETLLEPFFPAQQPAEPLPPRKKTKRERFHDVISKCKQFRSERLEGRQEKRDMVAELNARFPSVAERIKFTAKSEAPRDSIGAFNSVLLSLRGQNCLAPARPPRTEPPAEEESEASAAETVPQFEDEEAELADRRWQKPDANRQPAGILRFRTAVEELTALNIAPESDWSVNLDSTSVAAPTESEDRSDD